VPQYAFPYGVEVKRLKATSSFSEVNRIAFPNNFNEQNENNFVFLVNSDHTNSRSFKSNNEVIEVMNPSYNYYCVCVRTKDYYDLVNPSCDPSDQLDAGRWQKDFFQTSKNLWDSDNLLLHDILSSCKDVP
jgi:hypothetical protein